MFKTKLVLFQGTDHSLNPEQVKTLTLEQQSITFQLSTDIYIQVPNTEENIKILSNHFDIERY